MEMDLMEQRLKAPSSIANSDEVGSKTTAERLKQPAKHSERRWRTDAGMEIDLSRIHAQNACLSIDAKTDPGSKITVASDPHKLKQLSERTWANLGIQIDKRDVHSKNAWA
jgi:hypothetical protein